MSEIDDVRARVLVVDDEAPARQRIVQLLRQDSWVAEILEADNGMTAVDLIQE
jgi:two-component system LytT family response regulator